MSRRNFWGWLLTSVMCCVLWLPFVAARQDKKPEPAAPPAGLRVFTCGHSFHAFTPPILSDIAKSAGIKDHEAAGLLSIGGSRVIQHWNVPNEKNKAKELLKAGKVDVL